MWVPAPEAVGLVMSVQTSVPWSSLVASLWSPIHEYSSSASSSVIN